MTAGLWIAEQALLLASTSQTRRDMLEAAGLPVETENPGLDERAVEAPHRAAGAAPDRIAALLAREKALAVSRRRVGRLVVGADQTLDCEGRAFSKPADAEGAVAQILALAGRTHYLHSAVALTRDGDVLFETVTSAALTMRPLDESSVRRYVAAVGPAVTGSVGAYRLEGLGVHLFERIEGDHFTILGLPLIPLLAALRRERCLAA
ncbi:Maf family protein [Chelatococcus sp. SYSU_G07232]|uniref:Nucleoside triphosphate pyrophosphatase n=1 Tax=Chelatococcus albus TaxID=3047466 RepID=A0ABT7AH70_9HYPH|nr:Maf family protein [Chelatococcus sp. SYSU_G07232]MDJ1158718.1 Maf family protein [Chelatococcus sp. SYSU_G07232]